MKAVANEKNQTFYPENLGINNNEKNAVINQAFKDWVNSAKKFEFYKRFRGKAFPLALFLTLSLGILTIPALLMAPLLPSEIVMLIATPVCMLLTLPQICVLIEVSIEKFIHAKQQSMEKFSRKLNANSEEIEKELAHTTVGKKSKHCIIDGFKTTQYGTLFSLSRTPKNQHNNTVNILPLTLK